VFFLKAPRSLGDPDLRHFNARIGHAVSADLRTWQVLPDALGPGTPGAFDDLATWTGSVLHHGGRWYLHYTGVSRAEGGLVQRIGLATSDDLHTWRRHRGGPVLAADARWYEQLNTQVWIDETCRDPWVFADPTGGWRMYYTARVATGPADGRGVIGQAWSPDLQTWEAQPPLTEPGDFGHLEVPQLVTIGDRQYVLFCVYQWAHSAARLRRAAAVCGTHYLMGDSPLGPFRSPGDDFLDAAAHGPFYAGKAIQAPDGQWVFMAWAQFADDGAFIGALCDPVPLTQQADGTLRLHRTPAPPDGKALPE
jgi:beta-fructofuranosidase